MKILKVLGLKYVENNYKILVEYKEQDELEWLNCDDFKKINIFLFDFLLEQYNVKPSSLIKKPKKINKKIVNIDLEDKKTVRRKYKKRNVKKKDDKEDFVENKGK